MRMRRVAAFKTKTSFKIIAGVGIFLQIAWSLAMPVYADIFDLGTFDLNEGSGSLGSGSLNNIMGDVENRYHLNQSSIANLGENMNTSANKEMAPQVNLFFNPSDPKNGQEITAQAFPLYFSNQKDTMYFTWYLKRKGCGLKTKGEGLNDGEKRCDVDHDDAITTNDWKVEAMRRIANGGFAGDQVNYDPNLSGDRDGYRAQMGGDRSRSNYCYIHDFSSGTDYELSEGSITQYSHSISDDDHPAITDTNTPYGNTDILDTSTPAPDDYLTNDIVTAIPGSSTRKCFHFFPYPTNDNGTTMHADDGSDATGDGIFDADEERFWHTDPKDPSTAQNGNKDEANVVGLGQDSFKWNYAQGDQVGVVVEGLAITPTKHDDASMMVMWAFSKNKCSPTNFSTGTPVDGASYGTRGERAQIQTKIVSPEQWDSCLSRNLVNPTQGNQAGKLEVKVVTTPDNPVIDSFSAAKTDKTGDILSAQAILANSATKESNVRYDWKVYANSERSQTADDAWDDITEGLISAHAMTTPKGNSLSTLKVSLNIDSNTTVNGKNFFTRYFDGDVGYFRVGVTVTENFDADTKRVGRSSAIVKVTRAQTRIMTHAVDVDSLGKLIFKSAVSGDDGLLCETSKEDRTLCPVVKGQIVGLSFDTSKLDSGVSTPSDISWILNNKPLRCNPNVSSRECPSSSGSNAFFPVTGDVGELYTVTMMANNPASGKSLTLSRTFRVVDPSLLIVSADSAKVWPKYLGQYVDAQGKTTDNYSQDAFQAFSNGPFALKGLFYPSSLRSNASVSWTVNNDLRTPDKDGAVVINASQKPGTIYTVALTGIYLPSPNIKKAMADIWGISIADVTEKTLSKSIQVEMVQPVDGLALGPLDGSRKFFASIISYVPASVVFFFRLAVTLGLILLVLGLVFSAVPETRRT